jgi:hypothetical protein
MNFCHFFPVLNMFKHYICTQMSFRYSLRPMLSKSPYQLQEIAQQSAKHHTLDPERSSARCLPSMQNCEVKVTGLEARHWNLPKSEVQQPKHASPHRSCALGGGSPGFYIPGCKKSWLICHLIGQSPATRDATTELLSQLAFTSKSSGQHGGWVCLLTALMDSDPGHETEW